MRRPAGAIGWHALVCLILVSGLGAGCPALASAAHDPAENSVQTGLIGAGELWQTPWYRIDSGVPGPTVLVTGGIHGNEPAGAFAADQIRHWPIQRGRLVVVPRVNRLGLNANTRWIPEHRNRRELRDLNRNFPTPKRGAAVSDLGQCVWQWVQQLEPDWVIDLHEGFDFHRQNDRSVGSSVITFPAYADLGQALVDHVNLEIDPSRQFELLAGSGPAVGSLARAAHEQVGAASMILETTFLDQPVSLRAAQHRKMVSMVLQRIGVIEEDLSNRLGPGDSDDFVRVGVFDGPGANEGAVLKAMGREANMVAFPVGPGDISPATLANMDVLIFPGGSGSKQGRALGPERREAVRQYVRDGGGLIGICAGAYLCSSHYDWSLDLFNASVFNKTVDIPGVGKKSMWYRGKGVDVEVELNEQGAAILGLEGTHKIRYQNGPILSPGNDPTAPAYQVLALFRTENVRYEPQRGTMIGAPAVVSSTLGDGRVLAFSPHFESTPDRQNVIVRAVHHVRRQPVAQAASANQ